MHSFFWLNGIGKFYVCLAIIKLIASREKNKYPLLTFIEKNKKSHLSIKTLGSYIKNNRNLIGILKTRLCE